MPPKLAIPEDGIVSCLRESYGLTVTALEVVRGGYNRFARAYRTTADDGTSYFLKVWKGPLDEIVPTVPQALKKAGVRAVAPIPARGGGKPWGTVDGYALLLYPFISGQSAMGRSLSDTQWVEYGAILRSVHEAVLPDGVLRQVPRESFVPSWTRGFLKLQAAVEGGNRLSPHVQELAALWKEKRSEIMHIVERAEELGRQLRGRRFPFVLCHTDPHTNNILIDGDGRLFIVDWDAPLLAPKERDLHFVIGSVVGQTVIGPREEDLIFRGYGETTIDWQALTYYRYEWLSGDLLALGERVVVLPDVEEATKDGAIRMTRRMFEPGNAVASAYALERRSPTRTS